MHHYYPLLECFYSKQTRLFEFKVGLIYGIVKAKAESPSIDTKTDCSVFKCCVAGSKPRTDQKAIVGRLFTDSQILQPTKRLPSSN
jgi:hypothetical protein